MQQVLAILDDRLANAGDTMPLVGHVDEEGYELGEHEFALPDGLDYDLMLTNAGEGILATGIVRGHVVGTCDRCLKACPNQAIVASPLPAVGTQVDARRCASYHTIENRADTLPSNIKLSGYAFGCDCCQLICPYNQTAAVRYTLTDERNAQLEALADADSSTFRRATKHSPLNRIKHPQWLRNLRHK